MNKLFRRKIQKTRLDFPLACLPIYYSIYAWFDIVSHTSHPAHCYLNSKKVFLLLSNQYCNPGRGFEPGTFRHSLYLNLRSRLRPLDQHSQLMSQLIHMFLYNAKAQLSLSGFHQSFPAFCKANCSVYFLPV